MNGQEGDGDDYIMFYETIIGDVCVYSTGCALCRLQRGASGICVGRFLLTRAIFRCFYPDDKWDVSENVLLPIPTNKPREIGLYTYEFYTFPSSELTGSSTQNCYRSNYYCTFHRRVIRCRRNTFSVIIILRTK